MKRQTDVQMTLLSDFGHVIGSGRSCAGCCCAYCDVVSRMNESYVRVCCR